MDPEFLLVVLFLATGASLAWMKRKLTPAAAITGFICGLLIYSGSGLAGLLMLTAFFLTGTLVTQWRSKQKKDLHPLEYDQPRKAGQVLANGGAAALIGLFGYFIENIPATLLIAAAFSSATADTFSSELGNVYGKNYFNIITWKRDKRGLEGVVSVEGFIAGLIGSMMIALIWLAFTSSMQGFMWIMIAGTIGNITDSLLGATLERKKLIGNDVVNFLNTVVAVAICYVFYFSW